MPGFVKTPKDEARWKKAKEAAGKQVDAGSESYWKLSNYIYHKMGKTEEDQKMAELYKSEITNGFTSGKELSIENLRHFLMSDIDAKQSFKSNEVYSMSDEKKYSAREAAIAVLAKAEEMLKKSKAMKKNQPVGEIHPKEPQVGESEKPGARIKTQVAPEKNPKEQAEGNNELAGTTPTQVGQDGKNKPGFGEMQSEIQLKGHLKLAKFIGYAQAKRKTKIPGAI